MARNFNESVQSLRRTRTEEFSGKIVEKKIAMDMVYEKIKNHRLMEYKQHDETDHKDERKAPTKELLRERKAEVRQLVQDILIKENIVVDKYTGKSEGEKTEDDFIEEVVEELVGYSVLAPLFKDEGVSDIFCVEWNKIFYEKGDANIRLPIDQCFQSPDHYNRVVKRFMQEAGKEINEGDNKIVDFELFQDRGCSTSLTVTPKGYTITLRKHKEDHIVEEQLVGWKVFSPEMSLFFRDIITGECNLVYAGLTGSGKTTSIRAILDKHVTNLGKRMLVCEDTQELFPKNEHTVEMVTFKHKDDDKRIDLNDLIVTALRLKPKYIVPGEIRGKEMVSAVEAMETGHSTITTMHAGTAVNACNRMITKYLMAMPSLGVEVAERIIGSAVDYVAIQDNIPGIGRKITTITEIGYDFDKRQLTYNPIFKFDFDLNTFIQVGMITEEKADKMIRRGVKKEAIQRWQSPEYLDDKEKLLQEMNNQ